jgi:prolyl-tRNA editing enzyme YbaK/EbsC (Cys-tRNA(Pro) deacylase)
MKRIIIAGLLATMSVPALAQSAPSVGFQVSQTEYETLVKYLSGQPYATVAPVLAWLDNKEHAAQTQAHAAEMKAKTPKPNVTPSKGK